MFQVSGASSGGDLHRNRDGAAGLHGEPGQLRRREPSKRQLHDHQYAQQRIDHGDQGLHPGQCRDGAGGVDLYVGYGEHHAAERGRGVTRGVSGDWRQCRGDLHRNGDDGAAGLHGEPGELRRRGAQRQLHDHQYAQQRIDHGDQGLHPGQCRDGAGGVDLYVGYGEHHAAERGRGVTRGVSR